MAINRRDPHEVRQWWSVSPQLEEHAMRDGILELVNQIQRACASDDWEAMDEYMRLYELGEGYCIEEPQLSTYEMGKLASMTLKAEQQIDFGKYDVALEKLAEVLDLYRARMERYARLGQPPRRASQVRSHFLSVIARVKWLGDAQFRDSVLTPKENLDQILETVTHITDYITRYPESPEANPLTKDRVALADMWCLKLGLKFFPEKLDALVRGFNERNGVHVALEPLHFKNIDVARSHRSSLYWDFELSKLRMNPHSEAGDIYSCIELRSAAAPTTFSDWSLQGLYRIWRKEALVIVREVKARTS